MKKAYFNWSSGKDSSLALYEIKKDASLSIEQLVTSVNSHFNRVSMHGLRISLLQQQADAIGIPLDLIELPQNPSMEEYNELLTAKIKDYQNKGFEHCIFGDIFLEDLRTYRENQLKPYGITTSFPLWKKDTSSLIKRFIALGFKAIVICINSQKLEHSFLGRVIDEDFINDLPNDVDPCGEHGEFHTFCYDGPIFKRPIVFDKGEETYRTYPINDSETIGYWFLDLIPGSR